MSVKIIIDSTADITKDEQIRYDIDIAPLTIYTRDGEYIDTEIDLNEFYVKYLRDLDNIPTSSQPSTELFCSMFEAAAQAGREVLAISVSEELSGTMQAMHIAAEIVAKKYPEWNYEVFDSRSTGFQEGLQALAAAKCAQEGGSLEQCLQVAKNTQQRSKFLFVPDTLENLRKGGRIGRVSALLGTALQIRPLLGVKDGEVHVFKKVRTQQKALAAMLQVFKDDIETHGGIVDIMAQYIGTRSDGESFAKKYLEPLVGKVVPVRAVTPVVGVHVGPAVGLVYQTADPLWGPPLWEQAKSSVEARLDNARSAK